MKKLLILSAAGLIMASLPAFAQAPAPANDSKPSAETAKDGKKGPGEHGGEHRGQRLEDADANGDGMIEKSEFMAVSEKRFAEMDTDGDGKITKAEVEKRREEWRQKMKERRAERKKMMEEKKAKTEKPAETPAQ